jgi:4-carboxymuconolactone decarboxylase
MSSKNEPQKSKSVRMDMANPDDLTEAQRLVYDKIVSGKRGKIVGPLRVALHSPELADRWQTLGEYLRFQTDLPSEISELAIITTGRFWNSQVEWMIHARIAAESGVTAEIIEAIRTGESPVFENTLEALVYDFTRETLEFGQVGDATYELLHDLIGTAPLVELTAVIGYYSMVAMTLNVHHVPVPDSENAKPLDLDESGELRRPTSLPKATFSKAGQ